MAPARRRDGCRSPARSPAVELSPRMVLFASRSRLEPPRRRSHPRMPVARNLPRLLSEAGVPNRFHVTAAPIRLDGRPLCARRLELRRSGCRTRPSHPRRAGRPTRPLPAPAWPPARRRRRPTSHGRVPIRLPPPFRSTDGGPQGDLPGDRGDLPPAGDRCQGIPVKRYGDPSGRGGVAAHPVDQESVERVGDRISVHSRPQPRERPVRRREEEERGDVLVEVGA